MTEMFILENVLLFSRNALNAFGQCKTEAEMELNNWNDRLVPCYKLLRDSLFKHQWNPVFTKSDTG